jgi:ABC-type phosphate transport system substrate-binding protein
MLITKGEAKGRIRELIDFFCGTQGQVIVSELDYIPLGAKR